LWLTGSVEAGGASVGIELPLLYRNGTLSSLLPGGTLANLFGEDGLCTGIQDLGGGINDDLVFTMIFSRTNGGFRIALVRRSAAGGAYKLILEQGSVAVVDGVARAVNSFAATTQPFAGDGTLAFEAKLDGNQNVLLAARETTASPTVRVESPRRHRSSERRIIFRGTASDDGTVTQVRYRLNRRGERAAEGTTRWNFTTPRLREGRNRIIVQATDGDGGVSAPVRFLVRYMPR
jgi:hypothetical protein